MTSSALRLYFPTHQLTPESSAQPRRELPSNQQALHHLSDINRTGIIFEIAETELFRSGSVLHLFGLPYSEVFDRLGYMKPLVLDDLVEASANVGRFSNKSLTLRFEVTKKAVCWPAPVPEEITTWLPTQTLIPNSSLNNFADCI
jgi:hypothetical protein